MVGSPTSPPPWVGDGWPSCSGPAASLGAPLASQGKLGSFYSCNGTDSRNVVCFTISVNVLLFVGAAACVCTWPQGAGCNAADGSWISVITGWLLIRGTGLGVKSRWHMLSVQTHTLRWGKIKLLSWSFPIGALHPGLHGAGHVLLTEVSRRARRMLLSLFLSLLGARWDVEKCLLFIQTKSRVNPSRCAGGGRARAARLQWGRGLGGLAALISEHVAWLSCGVAESRQWAIAP